MVRYRCHFHLLNLLTAQFFGDSEPVIRWWAVFIAISAAGSMNSIIYTFSRSTSRDALLQALELMRSVKQAIGSGNILPWSRFWKSDCSQHANEESDRYKTPRGGLTLHWIMSVVLISASASTKDLLESISMPGLLQTYAHCFVLGERHIPFSIRVYGRADIHSICEHRHILAPWSREKSYWYKRQPRTKEFLPTLACQGSLEVDGRGSGAPIRTN
jgi:hypothetical protein